LLSYKSSRKKKNKKKEKKKKKKKKKEKKKNKRKKKKKKTANPGHKDGSPSAAERQRDGTCRKRGKGGRDGVLYGPTRERKKTMGAQTK